MLPCVSRARRIAASIALSACLLAAGFAHADGPAAPVRSPVPPFRGSPAGKAAPTTNPSADPLSWTQVGLSLGAVIGIILVLRWVGGRFFSAAGAGSSRAVQVLSRTILAPRQQLLLVQVGRRIVLVANSGAQVNPLCEIAEPDEVAELLGLIQREKGEAAGAAFASWFRRAQEPFAEQPTKDTGGIAAASAESQTPIDPDAAVTRQELRGLMDKVRLLSRQFRS